MALDLGYEVGEERESIWIKDPALGDVPEFARAEWMKDFDAAHLRPYVINGKPTIIKIRSLTPSEVRWMRSFFGMPSDVAYLECFRIAVRLEGAPEVGETSSGKKVPTVVREGKFLKLSDEFCRSLDKRYTAEFAEVYGAVAFSMTFPSEQEKKASSPPSTPSQSSEAGGTGSATAAAAANQDA